MSNHQHSLFLKEELLPSPDELMQELPLQIAQRNFIEKTRKEIRAILNGEDPRLLLIIGPCSIHDITAAKEYATKLRTLAASVSDTFLVIMRTYFEKPRTLLGWKGLLCDPQLDGSYDIHSGLRLCRQLLLDLTTLEIPAATEFLELTSTSYLGDLISWGCIGARTASSQSHRQMASGLPMPIAIKNNTDGNIEIAIHGIINAATPQTFVGINGSGRASLIRTRGNPDSHIALRGGTNKPNYDPQSISHALNLLRNNQLSQRLIIDCSHDNSFKTYEQQPMVFQSVIGQVVEGNQNIRGLILESHLFAGNQPLSADPSLLKYAVSVTDPCVDWETTERLVLWANGILKKECTANRLHTQLTFTE